LRFEHRARNRPHTQLIDESSSSLEGWKRARKHLEAPTAVEEEEACTAVDTTVDAADAADRSVHAVDAAVDGSRVRETTVRA